MLDDHKSVTHFFVGLILGMTLLGFCLFGWVTMNGRMGMLELPHPAQESPQTQTQTQPRGKIILEGVGEIPAPGPGETLEISHTGAIVDAKGAGLRASDSSVVEGFESNVPEGATRNMTFGGSVSRFTAQLTTDAWPYLIVGAIFILAGIASYWLTKTATFGFKGSTLGSGLLALAGILICSLPLPQVQAGVKVFLLITAVTLSLIAFVLTAREAGLIELDYKWLTSKVSPEEEERRIQKGDVGGAGAVAYLKSRGDTRAAQNAKARAKERQKEITSANGAST